VTEEGRVETTRRIIAVLREYGPFEAWWSDREAAEKEAIKAGICSVLPGGQEPAEPAAKHFDAVSNDPRCGVMKRICLSPDICTETECGPFKQYQRKM
jgi:hypothetical protein